MEKKKRYRKRRNTSISSRSGILLFFLLLFFFVWLEKSWRWWWTVTFWLWWRKPVQFWARPVRFWCLWVAVNFKYCDVVVVRWMCKSGKKMMFMCSWGYSWFLWNFLWFDLKKKREKIGKCLCDVIGDCRIFSLTHLTLCRLLIVKKLGFSSDTWQWP